MSVLADKRATKAPSLAVEYSPTQSPIAVQRRWKEEMFGVCGTPLGTPELPGGAQG